MMVQAFRETVIELRRRGDTTILLSSHVLAEVEETCDRIGLVRGGRIVATGTLEDLKRDATAPGDDLVHRTGRAAAGRCPA